MQENNNTQNKRNEEVVNTNSSFLKSNINNSKQTPLHINLKTIRQVKGLTQSDLARLCGFTSEYINMIERGKVFPILETRIKIAKAMNCDTSAIWIMEERR